MAYYSGQGRLYYGVRDSSGNPTSLIPFGNVPSLETAIEVTKFEHKESQSGSRAIDLSIVQEKKGTFTFTVEELSLANIALGFWGDVVDVSAGTAVTATITAKLGYKVPIRGRNNLTSVVITDNATGLITYEFGATENAAGSKNGYYDAVYGTVYVFPTATQTSRGAAANITEGQLLDVDFNSGAVQRVEAFTVSSQERFLRFEGLNTIDDSPVMIEIPKASFDPLTGYNLINEELGSFELNGNMLFDELQTSGSKFINVYYL